MRALAHDPTEGVFFTAVDLDGRLIELRQPHDRDVPCADCATQPARPPGPRTCLARAGGHSLEPGLTSLYPASGDLGHDCSAAFPGPVWTASTPRDGAVVATLAQAVGRLPVDQQPAALRAHVDATLRVRAHLRAVSALVDGDAAAAASFDVCLACLTRPADHASALRADLTVKERALAEVVRILEVAVQPPAVGSASRPPDGRVITP